jgi:hypothetical protein
MAFRASLMAMRAACCAAGSTPTAVIDYEKATLCDPATGASVLVISAIDSLTGVPTPLAYNMDGTAYAGAIGDLVACDTPDIESDPVEMCDGGTQPFLRWFIKRDGVITGAVDTSIAGLPYAPTGVTTIGECGVGLKPKLIYAHKNIDPARTMAQLFAAMTGATVIHSISVTQISGTGFVTGQTGGGFELLPGESHDWIATTLGMESLHTSALLLNAGGGVQHVTAVYSQ